MIPKKQQVVNHKLSEELKKAGYKQEGLWWWGYLIQHDDAKELDIWNINRCEQPINENDPHPIEKICVAPTVAELGEALPDYLNIKRTIYQLDILKVDKCWIISYRVGCAKANIRIEADTEANARAKMWLSLKKQGLIK